MPDRDPRATSGWFRRHRGNSVQDVTEVLDRLDELGASRERVTVEDIQECLRRDAFGPTLLPLGLLALSPIGDIPGAPTSLSIFIVRVGVQMAAGRASDGLLALSPSGRSRGDGCRPRRGPCATGRR